MRRMPLPAAKNLRGRGYRIIRLDCFPPAFGHAPSPEGQQAERNIGPAGDEGNRHSRHGGPLEDPQLPSDGVPPAALDGVQNLNSFDTARHSRKPRRTPSLSLWSGIRV